MPEGCEYVHTVVSTGYPTTIEAGGAFTETRDFQTTIPGTYILSSCPVEFEAKEGNTPFFSGTRQSFCYYYEEIPITVVAEDE